MNPLESKGRSLRAIAVVFLMLGLAFVGLTIGPSQVSAQDFSGQSIASMDGYIEARGVTYPGTTLTADTADTDIYIGQFIGGAPTYYYYHYRGYLSFNTSTVPDDAVIQQVKLKVRLSIDLSFDDFTIQAYTASYGTTLTTDDLASYTDYQGDVFNTAGASEDTWYSVNMFANTINKTGISQFMLKSNHDNGTAPTDYEFISIYSGDSASPPVLEVWYALGGTTLSIELDSGSYLNSTVYADVGDWNLTYDLWTFEFDTVSSAKNVSLELLNSSWEFVGHAPGCNYSLTTELLLLEDVADSICYRVWFAVPKVNPYTTVHLSLYNAFTGEGFYWEQMRVQICDGSTWDNDSAEDVARPDFFVEPEMNYTLRILDYFGNTLVDYSFVATAQDIFLSVPVPYYSWQVFNMNEAPVLMKIYWNNSGSPWEFFVGPQWIIERNLKGGNYTFMVTFYDVDGVAGETVTYDRVVPNADLNASFIMIEGTTLSEIVSDLDGVQAMQAILTLLVTPSTVLIYEDLPLAPVVMKTLALEDGLVIDPYLILEATTYQNDTGTEEVNLTLEEVHPGTYGYTYYVLSDVLSFNGEYVTTLYINDTDGNNLVYSNVLPATVNLDGEEVQIWANNNYSVSRASTWREVSEYTITYYQSSHKWVTTLNLNNSHTLDYYEPYWYIAFPEDAIIDQETVTIYDLDNDVFLSQRTNFDVTAGGVHVTLTQINASMERNFLLTMWDSNSSTVTGAPNLIAEAYTQSTLNGASMKYTSVQWTNPFSVEYIGEIYITLNFTYGDCLVPSSIHIVDETTGTEIPNSQYIYTGRTIIILTDGVGTVQVGGARSYGVYFTLDIGLTTEEETDFFFGPIVLNGQSWYIGTYAISLFMIVVIGMWAMTGWLWWKDNKNAYTMVILSASVTIVGAYLSQFM